MESYIKMHKIFEIEVVMDELIGASKELVIMTFGKPQKNYKKRDGIYCRKLLFGVI